MTETAGKEEGAPVRHKPDFYASENKRRWAVDLFKHGYGYTKVASILELSPLYGPGLEPGVPGGALQSADCGQSAALLRGTAQQGC